MTASATRARGRGALALAAILAVTAGMVLPAGAGAVTLRGQIAPTLAPALAGGALVAVRGSAADRRARIAVTLTLRRTDEAGFERFVAAVQNPRSRLYRHFLSERQLADRFGPSLGAYRSVLRWARRRGLTALSTSADRLTVTLEGSRAQLDSAFKVRLGEYREGRRDVYASTRAPSLPGSLARVVESVAGLSDIAVPHSEYITSYPVNNACGTSIRRVASGTGLLGVLQAAFYNVIFQLQALASDPFDYCFGPSAMAGGTPPATGPTGPGTPPGPPNTLVIIRHRAAPGASSSTFTPKLGLLEYGSFYQSDVSDFLALSGSAGLESRIGNLSEQAVGGTMPVPTPGAEAETLVDVDAALTLSDVPTVVYVGTPQTTFEQMLNAMLSDGDTIISISWAQCEDQTSQAEADAINSILAQAAATGVTVYAGSGDDGSTCGPDGSLGTVAVPADSPNLTAVGGTSQQFGPGMSAGPTSRWGGSDETAGSGFGTSRYFTRPSYEDGHSSAAMRSIPDLSFVADPENGIGICEGDAGGCPTGRLYGGTSMATPIVAALTANLDVSLGRSIGNANQALYPLAGTAAFNQLTGPDNDFAHAGLGSPNFSAILEALSGQTPSPASAANSEAGAVSPVAADGSSQGLVRVALYDASGYPLAGKTVTLTAASGSNAQIADPTSTTGSDGSATFMVSDSTIEQVTFTATDTTDGVTLQQQPTISFTSPVAAGAAISAAQTDASDATVLVYLQTAQGRPAIGKTVSLAQNGSATITPASGQATTDQNGDATFQVSDASTETVNFTATDVTDANLPVPGSVTVNFGSSAGSCDTTPPTAQAPYSFSPFISGLPFQANGEYVGGVYVYPCGSAGGDFDSSGNLYLADGTSRQVYKVGAAGGAVTESNTLPDTNFPANDLIGGAAVTPNGDLFVAVPAAAGNFSNPEILQLDPTTGAIERVAASASDGLGQCGFDIVADPVTGDLFADHGCNFGDLTHLERIANPSSAQPTITNYATLPFTGGFGSAQIAIDPAGTIYVAMSGSDKIVSVTGANGPPTPVVTTLYSTSATPGGIGVAGTDASGNATALYVTLSNGSILRLTNLGSPPATATVVATTSDNQGALGNINTSPDGCTYVTDLNAILTLNSGGPPCSSLAKPSPTIALSDNAPTLPATGSQVEITATLSGFVNSSGGSAAQGTPVRIDIAGANGQERLVDADASGVAKAVEDAVFPGVDTITASATAPDGTLVKSAPLEIHWAAGKDTSFLALNGSPSAGQIGQSATVTAELTDETSGGPVAGVPVTISLAGKSCTATTATDGSATCTLEIAGNGGMQTLSASYAGSATITAASATATFVSSLPPAGPPPNPPAAPSAPAGQTTTSVTPPLPGGSASAEGVQVSAFTVTPARFAVTAAPTALIARVKRGHPVKRRHPVKRPVAALAHGTSIDFTLSAPGTVTVTIGLHVPGLRSGVRSACTVRTAATLRAFITAAMRRLPRRLSALKRRRDLNALLRRDQCTALRTLGFLTRTGLAGPNVVPFSGRLGTQLLPAGVYTATAAVLPAATPAANPTAIFEIAVPVPKSKPARHKKKK